MGPTTPSWLSAKMIKTRYGETVLDQDDLCDLMMQGRDILMMDRVTVDREIDLQTLIEHVEDPMSLLTWTFPEGSDISVTDFHALKQKQWNMPSEYHQLDIAQHVLSLCETPEQLQRVGQELLLFQERDLFDLLKYLKYLVDVMRENHVIWGMGRGSSVSSYVLYLLGVHRIDSMYYDLDPTEFLR